MACSLRFIPPCHPTLRVAPPVGDGWLHEVKFDGWRVQLHKDGRHVALYTKSGYDYALQFRGLSDALRSLDADAAVIDGELVACDENDAPDFLALQSRTAISVELCIWAFDLLHLNGRDLCALPLSDRKYLLERIVHRTNDDWLRFSETFDDGAKLLTSAERMGLEGVVSKRESSRYCSGKSTDWIKVKCPTWRAANKDRWRLFDKGR